MVTENRRDFLEDRLIKEGVRLKKAFDNQRFAKSLNNKAGELSARNEYADIERQIDNIKKELEELKDT